MKSTLFFVISILAVSCSARAQVLEADQFEKAIADSGIQILDVRTANEYKSGHIKKALQADWNNRDQFLDRSSYLNKSKPVYIYCLSGGRSAAAAEDLRKKGYSVYELKGGIMKWKASGKALEGNNSAKQMSLAEYDKLINSSATVLVDFGAEWCPPCKQMEPVLLSLQNEKPGAFTLLKVDGGNDTDLLKKFKVEALPVFIVYKNGKQVWRKQGVVSKEELQNAIK